MPKNKNIPTNKFLRTFAKLKIYIKGFYSCSLNFSLYPEYQIDLLRSTFKTLISFNFAILLRTVSA